MEQLYLFILSGITFLIMTFFVSLFYSIPVCLFIGTIHFIVNSFIKNVQINKLRIVLFSLVSWCIVFLNAYRNDQQHPENDFAVMIPGFWCTGVFVFLFSLLFAFLTERLNRKIQTFESKKRKVILKCVYYAVFIFILFECTLYLKYNASILRIIFYSF